jgi:L-seryl-tRNA(Ser) seleniumtransferase
VGLRYHAGVRTAELPRIDELVALAQAAGPDLPRGALLAAARSLVAERRAELLAGRGVDPAVQALDVVARARAALRPSLRRVINATGVVLHTNLGRAPLAPAVAARAAELAAGYASLELDLDDGERGSRHDHVKAALGELTGAEDACVVGNGAGAVLLGLAALASGRGVVVSRGELVEIGGGFRIPDVMRQSGAQLVEIGTTNRTHVRDVEAALAGGGIGLLLKVHRSNFVQAGFVTEVGVAELVAAGRGRVPVMVDLGSGALVDLATMSDGLLPREPLVREQIAAGADLVTFSGDKLLGGPQAGLLVGRRDAIARARAHPLMRALRPDKLALAALAATLDIYRQGPAAARAQIPALAMMTAPAEELRARAERLAAGLPGVSVVLTESAIGGGALPTITVPSWALAVDDKLASRLRQGDPAIVGRLSEGRLLLDLRTVLERDEADLVRALTPTG